MRDALIVLTRYRTCDPCFLNLACLPHRSARILQAGSRGSPLAAGGSPRTPEPPAALPSLDEEARARQRAESRAEEMRLRSAFAQEKLAVEKLRTPTSQADAGTDSDLNAE